MKCFGAQDQVSCELFADGCNPPRAGDCTTGLPGAASSAQAAAGPILTARTFSHSWGLSLTHIS